MNGEETGKMLIALCAICNDEHVQWSEVVGASLAFCLNDRRRRAGFLKYLKHGDGAIGRRLQKTIEKALAEFHAAKARGEPVFEAGVRSQANDSPTGRKPRAKPVDAEAMRLFHERRQGGLEAMTQGVDA